LQGALALQCQEHEGKVLAGLDEQSEESTSLPGVAADAAETSFLKAIEISRVTQARSIELRATTNLARLLTSQGRRDEARAMLSEIYNWFTEGFDTPDLKDGKALLDELSA
jgi:adenylate cyclase